ncbi:MAG: alpha/beta fold hydrolase [Acetobacteraceae bacterium]
MATTGAVDDLLASARRVETPFDPADGPGTLVWHGWGAGPPIVLLHGGAGSWRHWVRNIPALAGSRTVWAPDLPGLGESSMPPMPYGPDRVAGIVGAGLRQILPAQTPCDLVGFSFGALAAGHVAASCPDLVRSLVLVGAGAVGVPRANVTLVPVRNEHGAARTEAHRSNLLRLMIADPAHIEAETLEIQDWNASRARVNSVGFAGSTKLLDALRRVRCPIAAIWGACDQVAVPHIDARAAAIRSVQPDAPVEIIPDAGHWVAYEAAAAFDAALARILAHMPPAGP